MLLPFLALAVPFLAPGEQAPANLANASFERGLDGWRVAGHRGFRTAVADSPSRPGAARGRRWLTSGWAARSAAPPGAETRITTLVDARPWRGRRLRLTAMTRVPEFADRAVQLRVRTTGPSGMRTTATNLLASPNWRRHVVDFVVPFEAGLIEIGFILPGTAAQLEADDLRIEDLRR
jgi:hypothetical protein